MTQRCAGLVDDSPYSRARSDAEELGARPLGALEADVVRQVARLIGARSVVCVTSGLGVAALAVLAAGVDSTVVTAIDSEPHLVEVARNSLREAGYGPSASRFIVARPIEVLDKLAESGYDLVIADSTPDHLARILSRSLALLRPGGALVLLGEFAPLPDSLDVPDSAHITVLPVGRGLTLVTL